MQASSNGPISRAGRRPPFALVRIHFQIRGRSTQATHDPGLSFLLATSTGLVELRLLRKNQVDRRLSQFCGVATAAAQSNTAEEFVDKTSHCP